MNFWGKRIKDEKRVADALDVSVDDIKALKDNRLEIGGETMERTLRVIESEKINKAIKDNEIWKWILNTDFKQKREEFGYPTQKEVAKKIKCDSSLICKLETNKGLFTKLTPKLVDVYNFYTNDFNKKYKKVYNTDKTRESVNKDNKHIWKWYKNTDIRALRISMGLTGYDIARKIGVAQSCVSDLELKRCKTINKTMINAYNYFNNIQADAVEDNNEMIYDWYTSIDDIPGYRREFGYSLNKFMSVLSLSYDQARTFERKEYKKATPVVIRAYNFYHNEKNRLPKINWEPAQNNAFVVKQGNELPSVDDADANVNKEIADLKAQISYLTKLNEKYEQLIDKLISRI